MDHLPNKHTDSHCTNWSISVDRS